MHNLVRYPRDLSTKAGLTRVLVSSLFFADLLEFKDLSAVDHLFDDVVRVLLKIIENSDSSATVSTKALYT